MQGCRTKYFRKEGLAITKKYFVITLTVIFLAALVCTAFANEAIKIFINGKEMKTDVEPQIINGRVMVPLRWVIEAMGASIEWDQESKSARITAPQKQAASDWGTFEAVILNENNNGGAITVLLGQTLELSLPGNLTTGYSWLYTKDVDGQVLKETAHNFQQVSALIGAGGTEKWIYKAEGAGSATLSLKYCRPWESTQPLKTFTFDVTVVSAPLPANS